MADATHKRYPAEDRSYGAFIKKEIHREATAFGFGEKRLNEIDLVVSELTSNLTKHARAGELLSGFFDNGQEQYLELISIDHGPGIVNVNRMMKDGTSSLNNSMGQGLGSIERLSDTLQIYSLKDWGTIVLVRICKTGNAKNRKVEIRPIVIAKTGEEVSGDAFSYKQTPEYLKIMLGDGLGHGVDANAAVSLAVDSFNDFKETGPVDTIRYMHEKVRKSRGLVATIATYHFQSKVWQVAGVGNISLRMMGPAASKSQVAYNGIIGHNIPRTMNDTVISENQYNRLVFCSDGIQSRWDPGRFPLIDKYDATIMAAAIYKEFARMTDDTSVVVVRIKL